MDFIDGLLDFGLNLALWFPVLWKQIKERVAQGHAESKVSSSLGLGVFASCLLVV